MLFTGKNVAALVIGAGLVAAGIGAGQAGPAGGPLRCEIKATKSGGMLVLAGVVHADKSVAGSYSFRVAGGGGGGSTNISQGGEFSAAAGQPETLGEVMLGARGAYDASLEVSAGGKTYRCKERVGAT